MKTYKSKFGYEIILFLTLLLGGVIIYMLNQNESLEAILSTSGIFLVVYLFFIYLNYSTKYIIKESGVLEVKCSFFYKKEIEILKIKSIAKTRDLISSPAPSLDRIELIFNKFDSIIISPKNKNEFAIELMKINPEIENKLAQQKTFHSRTI